MNIKKILFAFAIVFNVLAVIYGGRLVITKVDSGLVRQFPNNPEKYSFPPTAEEKKYGKTLLIMGIVSLSGLLSSKVVIETAK